MEISHERCDVIPIRHTSRPTDQQEEQAQGPKPPLRVGHVWSIRARLQLERRIRDLALFNLAIDSKLRGCDLVALRVDDAARNGYAIDRANVQQRKTGRSVRFELTEVTRQAVDDYLRISDRRPGQCLFRGRGGSDRHLTTRQYARLVGRWVTGIGLDPLKSATHSMRRTKATLIYRRTGNLRAVQLLLGHIKIEKHGAVPRRGDRRRALPRNSN
jgi:integrase